MLPFTEAVLTFWCRAYDYALPDELFKRVLEEALVFEAHEKAERAKAVEGGLRHLHTPAIYDAWN